MRAAELIGCQVYDADGQPVGTVHDLQFRLHTRPDGTQACQLDALECGGIGLGHRLGYGEGDMRGPWPFPDTTVPRTHYPDQRHSGVFNVLYCDGHVETKTIEETLQPFQWGERGYIFSVRNSVVQP